ncbi:MAG: hypothetical protein H6713_01900 [Myxococcales bacterium]|nr:hypothetical protein [Myxococcales bacterium]MCB9748738.1 hypothetical protein [Myxococcales bacterium]
MANVVYGVFPSNEASEPAIHELVNHTPPFSVQTFENQPIDANHLPEGATEFGRNIVLSTIWGGVLGAIFGLVSTAFYVFPGFGPVLNTLFGAASGVIIAFYTVIMAGTRIAKQPILEIERQLGDGPILLVIETESRKDADTVAECLEKHAADPVDYC